MQTTLFSIRSSSILRHHTVNEKCSQNKNKKENVCAINNANELASAYVEGWCFLKHNAAKGKAWKSRKDKAADLN